MEKEYCFDIAFPSADFDSYMPKSKPCKKAHHSHLISRENEIEIKIYFNQETSFDRKLSFWLENENWKKIGLKIKVENENVNARILKIDLSEIHLLKVQSGSRQINENSCISLFIDRVKIYWEPVNEAKNTAEFYLNDSGFKLVSQFYAPMNMFGGNGEFKINRMNDSNSYFKIKKGEFRPEFHFAYSDNKNASETKIIKEPFFSFQYSEDISETEALEYAEIACFISSFYYHSFIDYSSARIHLIDKVITIKKITNPQLTKPISSGLWGAKCYPNFNDFLKSDWQTSAFKNKKKLKKVIEKLNQSLIINDSSRFLILYNIIEICMGGNKEIKPKFNLILDEKKIEAKYEEALNIISKTIDKKEYDDFKNKWNNVKRNMTYKPMVSPLKEFLQTQNLNPDEFPITLKTIVQMRSDLTHGSINSVKSEKLEKTNTLLYRISLILILNLLGIDKWELNTEL